MIRVCAASLMTAISQPQATKVLTLLGHQSAGKTITSQLSRYKFTRALFTSSKLFAEETQNSADDEPLWIEDNLKLSVKDSENSTLIEAIPVSTGREDKLVKIEHERACVLCRLNLRNLDYTDVMILSQFIKRNGSLVTYHESKLCTKQYKKIERLIRQAQRCNLIHRPADYLVPGAWHDLNTYLEPDRKRDQPMKYVKKEYWKL